MPAPLRGSSLTDWGVIPTQAGYNMARRNLLTREERERLFLPRTDHFSIIRNYTLTVEDLDIIGKRRGPVNRLGIAAHLALLRHPGFGLRTNSDIPDAILN